MTYEWAMLLATFFPGFVGAFAILILDLLFRNRTNHRSAVSGVVALITFAFVAYSNWQQAALVLARASR